MEYKIGQILTTKEEMTLEGFCGDKTVVPKGSKIIIGADNMAHHFRGGYIQPLSKEIEVKGYDSTGLAEYIYRCLNGYFGLDDVLEDNCIEEDDFKERIEYALDEIGL